MKTKTPLTPLNQAINHITDYMFEHRYRGYHLAGYVTLDDMVPHQSDLAKITYETLRPLPESDQREALRILKTVNVWNTLKG